MNNIQQYIELIKSEKENANKKAAELTENRQSIRAVYFEAKYEAFSFSVQLAELLLKHDESNQPQPPDFANTMLGEVPPVGHSNISESSQAVEGETRLVGQNEQTKKDGAEYIFQFYDNWPPAI